MKNQILEHDKAALVNTNWFQANDNFKQYEEINIETAERVLNYEVEKAPLYTGQGFAVPKAYCLWREDIEQAIYPFVGERYHVVQNTQILDHVSEIIKTYDNVKIENVVTLGNGQSTIINLRVFEHVVKGDDTPTQTRLMMTNSFGAESLTACIHQLRMSCANMMRLAHSQGAANASLKRFRHTKTITERMGEHVFDLAAMIGKVKEHNEVLDELADRSVNTAFVDNFLENLFPSGETEGAKQTAAKTKQSKVRDIFDGKSDLQGVGFNRYRLLNAVTDYASHSSNMRGTECQGRRMMNAVNGGGDKLNQQAFELLTV